MHPTADFLDRRRVILARLDVCGKCGHVFGFRGSDSDSDSLVVLCVGLCDLFPPDLSLVLVRGV